MPKSRLKLDIDALVAALDAKREDEGISWRELGRRAGVSPSTLTRMHQGKRPDVNSFASLISWLGLPAEDFLGEDIRQRGTRPHPLAVASTLLRGKREMSPKAAEALDALVRAAYRLFKEIK